MSYEALTRPCLTSKETAGKKHPSLKGEFAIFIESLAQSTEQGVGLANNCYKIRIAIASKGKGKSGGPASSLMYSMKRVAFFTCYL